MTTASSVRIRSVALAGAAALVLTGCAGQRTADPAAPGPGATPDTPASSASAPEVSNPRLSITYDGGVMIVEEESLQHVADLPAEGFLRLNAAGNQRHLLVSTAEGFQVLDTGVEVRGHGDHHHLYGHEPR